MPLVDMPLAELQQYRGTNAKPADFDEFWSRRLAELDATDPQIEISPASFRGPADAFDLRFSGVGGARVYAKLLRPKNLSAPAPAVLMFHGYTMSSGDWHDKLGYVAAGFNVFAMDCRGQGGKSEDPGGVKGNTLHGHLIRGLIDAPERMLMTQIFLDTAQLARVAMSMPEVDAERVVCTGASQGGGLTLACAALEPKIRKAAPWYPFLSDYKRVWDLDLASNAYLEIKNFFRAFDPRHECEPEIFERLGYIDVHHLAPRIRAETMMAIGLADQITPPSTCYAAFNNIPGKKQMLVYPDFGHESLPGFGDMAFQFLTEV
jgi:cephalosporin-C deacetylase